jgi:DNA-binding transcriptional regulator YdaS (Cro superfamily)
MAAPRTSTLKRVLAGGGAVLVLSAAASGVAWAQTPTPTRPPAAQTTPTPQGTPGLRDGAQRMQQFWEAVARRLGITPERLQQAISEARTELGLPAQDGPRGRGFPGGPGGPGAQGTPGAGGVRGVRVRLAIDVAAQTLGLTPEQLRQELSGRSVADLARARNIDPARVVQAMRDDAFRRIDQAAADGRIQAGEVAGLKERASQEIDRFVNQVQPARGQGPRPGATPTPRPS